MTTRHKPQNSDRFAAALAQSGISGAELARLLGLDNEQNITNWKKRGVPHARITAVAEALGVSRQWLESGEGSMHANAAGLPAAIARKEPSYSLEPLSPWDDSTPLDDDEVEVPFYKEVELSSGHGRTAVREIPGRKLRFSYATLRACNVEPANAACATNTGDSNAPLILHGAAIGIDRGMTRVVDGEIYAVDHDGVLRVKFLHRLPGGGLRVASYNKADYPDEHYSPEQLEAQSFRILGRVFWWSTIRPLKGFSLA